MGLPFDEMWEEAKIEDPSLVYLEQPYWKGLDDKMKLIFPREGQYEELTEAWELLFPNQAKLEDLDERFVWKFFYLVYQKIWNGQHWIS